MTMGSSILMIHQLHGPMEVLTQSAVSLRKCIRTPDILYDLLYSSNVSISADVQFFGRLCSIRYLWKQWKYL